MIELYYWPTPNGQKVAIMLEETGLAYETKPVDIQRGEQFEPDFLHISPNNKIPAIVDTEGPGGQPISLMESAAILLYLADKTGRFMPGEPRRYWDAMQWLMFQMGSVGPMFGQVNHFRTYAPEQIPYAVERYTKEAGRIYGVLDKRLGEQPYLAGDYSIADMAVFPWTNGYERQGQDIEQFPNVVRWRKALQERPAVQKALDLLKERRRTGPIDEEARRNMFGDAQYQRR